MFTNKFQPQICKIADFVYRKFFDVSKWLIKHNVSANFITLCGIGFAIFGLNFLALNNYVWAFICLIFNRICDILDGMVARLKKITPFGIFFDIFADYTSFALFILGFTLANPDTNSAAGIFYLVTFIMSAVALLAYALISKQDFKKLNQSLFKMCLWGNIQNFDTFIALFLMCLFNSYFMPIAMFFALLLFGKSLIIVSKAYYILEINGKG